MADYLCCSSQHLSALQSSPTLNNAYQKCTLMSMRRLVPAALGNWLPDPSPATIPANKTSTLQQCALGPPHSHVVGDACCPRRVVDSYQPCVRRPRACETYKNATEMPALGPRVEQYRYGTEVPTLKPQVQKKVEKRYRNAHFYPLIPMWRVVPVALAAAHSFQP
jgi:hypothetical protein